MIKSGGFNVFPEEVENVIIRHRAVAEVAVFDVSDKKWGQMICAAVVLKTGESVTAEEITGHCRQYLSGFQVPKKVHFMDRLPVTESQLKISKITLREMFG